MNATSDAATGKHAEQPATSRLHPRVYAAVVGLAAWLALSVWSFAGAGVTDYLLFVVNGFIFVVVALALILARVGRSDASPSDEDQPSFHDWAKSNFDTWQDRISGAEAATQILLPIAAAAFGMTAFGIALHVAEHGILAARYSSGSVVKNSGKPFCLPSSVPSLALVSATSRT